MIKRLELQGFKSFDKKISIPLSNGFTAIVGPNGSGKSNTVDAICFVLGRTSARTMRAERLTHLIYNGGDGKSPAKHLEVSLALDNSKREYPFDSDEVLITRRLTRNGTMSYKLNGQRCTRTQLVDFLSSSKLTPTGYNIVLQGDITSFIEMDAIQRRQIIDDICGISEYDEKKALANKDLGAVEVRIKELVIVMSERKKYVNELGKEKADAEKYQELNDEHSNIEANLAFSKLKDIEAQESELNQKIKDEESKENTVANELKETETKIRSHETELKNLDRRLIKEGGEDRFAVKNEVERIQGQISINLSKAESKRSEISRLDSMVSKLQSFIDDRGLKRVTDLKDGFDGVYGAVGELIRVDPKYAVAIDSVLGSRKNYVVVDNDSTALACINYLKQNKAGRATFLPLNKVRGMATQPMRGKGVLGLALNMISFDQKFRGVLSYIFGNTYLVDDLKKVRGLFGKFRMVSLDGDVAEKSGALTGGYKKRTSKPGSEIDEYIKGRDKLLDEIEDIQLENNTLEKQLEESKQRAQKLGINFNDLEKERDSIEDKITRLRSQKEETVIRHNVLQRAVGDLRIENAKIDAQLVDIKINMDKFKDRKFEKIDVEKMETRLVEIAAKAAALEPVNMKSIDLYKSELAEFKEFETKFEKLREERDSVIGFIEDIESKKKDVFYNTFNKVSDEFSLIYPKLSPNGQGKLILESEEDPLAGGLFIEASPGGKKLLSMESMSGGEKVITALSFLFSLQKCNPAPFYVLDEVDAALDQKNSIRFANLLKERVKDSQLLVISHNNTVVKEADSIFGVSMGPAGISKMVGMDLRELASNGTKH